MQIFNIEPKMLDNQQQISLFTIIRYVSWLLLYNGVQKRRHNCIAKFRTLITIRWRLCIAMNHGTWHTSFATDATEKKNHHPSNLSNEAIKWKQNKYWLLSPLPCHTLQLAIFKHDFRNIFIESAHKLFGAN